MPKYKLIYFKEIKDARGNLIVCEKDFNCPFGVKRVFFMYKNSVNAIRGKHANKKSQFLLISAKGSCKVRVYDGENSEVFLLNSPNFGLYIGQMVWKEIFDFSDDSILLILSSRKYDPEEYVKEKAN